MRCKKSLDTRVAILVSSSKFGPSRLFPQISELGTADYSDHHARHALDLRPNNCRRTAISRD